MRKNKNYIVYDKHSGDILMAHSSPFEPLDNNDQGFIEGVCVDIHECKVDLITLKIKEK